MLLNEFCVTASFCVFVSVPSLLDCYTIRRPIRVCETFGVSTSLSLNSLVIGYLACYLLYLISLVLLLIVYEYRRSGAEAKDEADTKVLCYAGCDV